MIILTLKLTFLTIPTQLILDDLRKQGLQETLEKMKDEKKFKQVVKVNDFIQWSVEKQIWQIYYPSYK